VALANQSVIGYISSNKDNFFLDQFQKQGVTVLTLGSVVSGYQPVSGSRANST
jgi:hypothetical protein